MIGDTIVALASGWGLSPRAILRVSGPASRAMLADILLPRGDGGVCGQDGQGERGGLSRGVRYFGLDPLSIHGSGLRVPCLVVEWVGPKSFTGEDGFELLVPGNPHLVERMLAQLCAWQGTNQAGTSTHQHVREATPGEFSARAFLSGKMTLGQAEGIAATIAAGSASELESARRLLDGSAGLAHRRWADEVAMLLALVEAGIDFTDQEDVVPISGTALDARLSDLIEEMTRVLGPLSPRERAGTLPRVVLIGAPNAGKSTLFNALLGHRRAVESAVPGTTRDVLVEELSLSDSVSGGGKVLLVDLAGLDASESLGGPEAEAQRAAQEAIDHADVALLCRPAGAAMTRAQSDDAAGVGLRDEVRRIRVRTKADLPAAKSSDVDSGAGDWIDVCALDGRNLGVLKRAIADAAGGVDQRGSGASLPRHRRMIALAINRLLRAKGEVHGDSKKGTGGSRALSGLARPELVAGELRAGLDALGELIGQISPDDIIGRIFSTFCVGK